MFSWIRLEVHLSSNIIHQGHVEGGGDRGEPPRALGHRGWEGELHHTRGGGDEEVHGESPVLQQSGVCP